ncbi:MAG: PhnD/SsuA/transferrin family substrate-binding protein [Hydrogenophilales bacterium]|nr:PhnD/SsuA/transferrin family substrate-binding protein [Hydrogenophilales bacterium]
MRRVLLVGALALVFAASPVRAANVLFGIAEGVAEQASFGEMQDKYQPLADYLGRVLKNKVTLESSQNIPSAMANLQKGRFDLMFCRPSNVSGKAIRDNKYQLVAMAKGDFAASFIARKDHAFKKPEDVLSKIIALPEESSLMAKAGLATLRDMGGKPKPEQLRYTRYQEAVNFMLEMKFADVGIVAPAQAKAWEKKGGVIFFKSKKLPYWSIIASPKMSKGDVEKMQKALIEMESSDEGKKILAKIGVKGWVPGKAQEYVEMLSWLGM